jgi:hypothetical protein
VVLYAWVWIGVESTVLLLELLANAPEKMRVSSALPHNVITHSLIMLHLHLFAALQAEQAAC